MLFIGSLCLQSGIPMVYLAHKVFLTDGITATIDTLFLFAVKCRQINSLIYN